MDRCGRRKKCFDHQADRCFRSREPWKHLSDDQAGRQRILFPGRTRRQCQISRLR
jgi:hypothetical protein